MMEHTSRYGKVALAAVAVVLTWQIGAIAQGKGADHEKAINALIAQGKLEDAVEEANAWVREDPQATKPHLALGDIYGRLKLYDKAALEFDQVTHLNPASATGHFRRGDMLRLEQNQDEAAKEYTAALRLDSKCAGAYAGLALIALSMDQLDNAHSFIDAGLRTGDETPASLALFGQIELQIGDVASAEKLLRKSLEKDPNNADGLFGLASAIQAQGKEAEAQQTWDKFLAVETGTDRAWLAKYGLVVLSDKMIGGSPGADQHPVFSPDGKTLAFQAQDNPGDGRGWELWTMPADGSKPAECITTGGGTMFPRWTLDGKELVFDFLYEATGTKKRVYALAVAGGNPRCLTPDSELAYSGAPIPGTDRFLFCDGFSLLSVGGQGADWKRLPMSLPPGYQPMHLSVSPDGKNVVYCATNWPKDGQPNLQLYISPLDGSAQPRLLTHEDVSGRIGSHYPEWGPDGKRILYSSDIDAPRKAHSTWVMVLDDPHEPYELIHPGARATWSPDGTKIAFDRWMPNDPDQIFMVTLGGKRLPVVKPEPGKP